MGRFIERTRQGTPPPQQFGQPGPSTAPINPVITPISNPISPLGPDSIQISGFVGSSSLYDYGPSSPVLSPAASGASYSIGHPSPAPPSSTNSRLAFSPLVVLSKAPSITPSYPGYMEEPGRMVENSRSSLDSDRSHSPGDFDLEDMLQPKVFTEARIKEIMEQFLLSGEYVKQSDLGSYVDNAVKDAIRRNISLIAQLVVQSSGGSTENVTLSSYAFSREHSATRGQRPAGVGQAEAGAPTGLARLKAWLSLGCCFAEPRCQTDGPGQAAQGKQRGRGRGPGGPGTGTVGTGLGAPRSVEAPA